ncbi:ATP-dependent helicase [Nocardia salmonicida]|uniref:ATP-dependent helicase n=1 Tax=Nocardia salmonicida TaxID=53431 RepID=UPI003410A1EF
MPVEPKPLTTEQLAASEYSRNMFLSACPGSGKTRTAATRIARLDSEGMRVAACSYTNVGVGALRQTLAAEHQLALGPEHYLGTLHGLLLRTVTYPFGHLRCGATPRLLPDESSLWPEINVGTDGTHRCLKISSFRRRSDNTSWLANVPYSVGLDHDEIIRRGLDKANQLKTDMAAKGWLSFDDAMFIALQVLRKYPHIAGAVARRFDEILVDEAQDTSELQTACLRALTSTGALRSLVLVGDLDQSISSYNGASIDQCADLAKTSSLKQLKLTENHRSSQLICNIAAKFRSRRTPDLAVGRDSGHPVPPELFLYPPNDPRVALIGFRQRLRELGENPKQAAVLTRGNNLCDEINSGETVSVDIKARTQRVGRVIAALRSGATISKQDIDFIESTIAYTAFGERHDPAAHAHDQRSALRTAALTFLQDAPQMDTTLDKWIKATAKVLTTVSHQLTNQPEKTGGSVLRTSPKHGQFPADKVFLIEPSTFRAQTIHDIKGETRDSALIVLDRKRRGKETQSELWAQRLRHHDTPEEQAEEVRIAFVALTRPRRYCAVAIPSDSPQQAIEAFKTAGFLYDVRIS